MIKKETNNRKSQGLIDNIINRSDIRINNITSNIESKDMSDSIK